MIRSLAEPGNSQTTSNSPAFRCGTARIGAVTYLNSRPLIEGLEEILTSDQFRLDYPSRLADDLHHDRLDVALIPSIEYFQAPDYRIISDACVATRGPVLSVKLYSRVPLGEIRTLALDEGSRTSAALSRVMLAERYGVFPKLESLPLSLSTRETRSEAILLIGDRAIHAPEESFEVVWDLGEEWVNWTGLPFVFAMWVGRQRFAQPALENLLSSARDRGLASLDRIASRESLRLNLSESLVKNYLKENLHFQLGSAEKKGLELFQQLASQLGLIKNQE